MTKLGFGNSSHTRPNINKSECDDDGNFIAFTATTVVNESIFAKEKLFDGELSEDADLSRDLQ